MDSDEFERHRPFLMGIAYRMLGSSAEAEDVVQDAWLRLSGADPTAIADARAYLSTTTVRLCIDRLKSARAQRETYPGSWLPEPVLTTSPLDVESIELGFLVLLERLNPKERAVFLLHQVFDYSHAEIGEMLDMSEAGCRQIFHRAKKHVAAERPRFVSSRETHERLLFAFLSALAKGDVDAISNVLAEDVALYGDNAGKGKDATVTPIMGRRAVSRFFAAKSSASDGRAIEIADVNGWPAVIGRVGGVVTFVINIETDGEKIVAIRSCLSPEKLRLRHVS